MKIPTVLFFTMLLMSAGGAHAYQEGAVQNGGVISGTVRFVGKAPEPQKMAITKDPDVCAGGVRVVGKVTTDAKGGLSGSVVYIEKIASGRPWPKAREGFVIDQKGCNFIPNSLVMRKGDSVRVKNKDNVFHNIHAYELVGSARLSMFNEGQQAGAEFQHDLRMRRGNEVKLECDAHNFMHEWFLVLDHPYFAPTDKGGSFAIGDIPPGTYNLVAWNPVLGRQETTVAVKAGGKARADFTFKR